MYKCNICNEVSTSQSKFFEHKREEHTYFNCINLDCELCGENYYSVTYNRKSFVEIYKKN